MPKLLRARIDFQGIHPDERTVPAPARSDAGRALSARLGALLGEQAGTATVHDRRKCPTTWIRGTAEIPSVAR